MKSLVTTFLFFFLAGLLMAAAPIESVSGESEASEEARPQNQLFGFQGWKQARVFEARTTLNKVKTIEAEDVAIDTSETEGEAVAKPQENLQLSEAKKALSAPIKAQQNEEAERLHQLEFNLEIALGLTIHDYFALYLKNKNKQDMAMAIEKLSPSELSELLIAYRKNLYGSPVVEKKSQKEIQQNL